MHSVIHRGARGTGASDELRQHRTAASVFTLSLLFQSLPPGKQTPGKPSLGFPQTESANWGPRGRQALTG